MADEVAVSWADKASVLGPAYDAFAVTPSDSVDFTTTSNSNAIARALYIGTAGDLVLKTARGNLATFVNISTAQILPVEARRVNFTGTTAGGIVALY